jgi:hypothetical protein
MITFEREGRCPPGFTSGRDVRMFPGRCYVLARIVVLRDGAGLIITAGREIAIKALCFVRLPHDAITVTRAD